jgi:sigma-B regulation protein RsbU (phosphoserine phosphatase)
MKILIAEDERITRRTLQRQLEKWGHEVVAAEDGQEAWEQYRKQDEPGQDGGPDADGRFDIVVTDWDMPRCDGRELVSRIRGADEAGYVYVIMLTGRSEKTDVVAGMEAGADDFVAKPFDRDELRVRLNAGERIIRLERTLAQQNAALGMANGRMKRDLDAAAEVQQGLLPSAMPDAAGATFAWHYEPCDELAGDILDVLPLDDRFTALYLLDVSGHGVPAALLSVTLNRVLTTRDPASSVLLDGAAGSVAAPSDVAARLNRQFPMATIRNRYFTMVYGVLDSETGVLRYTLAGQPPPVLVRAGQPPRLVEGSGFPVGIVDEPGYDDYTVELGSGDRIYFYSDGITEASNAAGDMLDNDGFLGLIEASRALPLEESVKRCIADLEQWTRPVPFADDVSLLALERAP